MNGKVLVVGSLNMDLVVNTAHLPQTGETILGGRFATIPGGKGALFCHTPLVAVARNLGRKRALEMALTGDAIDAATAAEWGLINKAVPDTELDAAVHDLLTRATRGSVASKALGKQGFYAQVGLDQRAAYAEAVHLMSSAATSPDAQEGIAAFLEKRKPAFTEQPAGRELQ